MDYTEREPAPPVRTAKRVAGEWYVRGFSDGYHARVAVIPDGSAGEQYDKGYSEGLEAALRAVSAQSWNVNL